LKIYLNDKELDNEYRFLTLPELLESVKDDIENRILKQILVNGTEVEEKYLSEKLIDKEDIQVIKFVTQRTDELIKGTLNQIDEYLHKLKDGIEETVDLFRTGETNKANKMYQQIIEGLDWYIQVTTKILSLLNTEGLKKKGNNKLNDLNEILGEIMEAQENEDTVLIADILEYEISRYIEEFMDFNDEINNFISND
jgi:hypothetical protein